MSDEAAFQRQLRERRLAELRRQMAGLEKATPGGATAKARKGRKGPTDPNDPNVGPDDRDPASTTPPAAPVSPGRRAATAAARSQQREAARSGTRRRTFGDTWWGRAWVDALEQRAQLDPNRLPRGRTYARHSRVLRLDVEPGSVSAFVQGNRVRPYRVLVSIRTFGPDEWDRVLGAVAGRAAHAAALLDGELDPGIVDDAGDAGVDLLPGPGELTTACSCPDDANPCKHAAAVCYLAADLLDADPFTLFLLRGRSRDAVLAEVRERRAGSRATDATGGATSAPSGARTPRGAAPAGERTDEGVIARDAFAPSPGPATADTTDAALLAAARLPDLDRPGRPAPLAVEPPGASGIDADALDDLATDAAHRAWAVLVLGSRSGLADPLAHDVARRAAPMLGTRALDRLARRAGFESDVVSGWARSYQQGGDAGLAALLDDWPAPVSWLDEAVGALVRSGEATSVEASGNRAVADGVALHVARDGLWFRFEVTPEGWLLTDGPADDPADLTTPGPPDRADLGGA